MSARLRYTAAGNLIRVPFVRPEPTLEHGSPRRNVGWSETLGQIAVWVLAWVIGVGPWVALGFWLGRVTR